VAIILILLFIYWFYFLLMEIGLVVGTRDDSNQENVGNFDVFRKGVCA